MTPVYQTDTSIDKGNCLSASVASLLHLKLHHVPNFIEFDDDTWLTELYNFFYDQGYDITDVGYPKSHKLEADTSVFDGLILASASSPYPDRTHSLIIDVHGNVVHDPQHGSPYHGTNIIETGNLEDWFIIKRLDGGPI